VNNRVVLSIYRDSRVRAQTLKGYLQVHDDGEVLRRFLSVTGTFEKGSCDPLIWDSEVTCATSHLALGDITQPVYFVSMSIQDRTTEFRTCVDSIRNRSTLSNRAADAKQRLIHAKAAGSKSEFSRLANGIGREISSTDIKLNKLGQCVYTSSLTTRTCFDVV
jgi:hypothetical protein